MMFTPEVKGGTKYYISSSGNDDNLGTSFDEAWQTIGKVNSTDFEPGDTIAFQAGQLFYGSLSFNAADSGTALLPVTVCSFGAGRATINSGNQTGLYAYNCAGFIIEDLIFIGSGRTDSQGKNGIAFYNDLDHDVKLDFIRINNVDVSGYHQTGIALGGGSGLSGFKDVRITNSTIHDNGDKGINVYGYWLPPKGWANQDIYIGYCKAFNNPGIPNKSPHSGNGIMISQTEGGVIEYCEAYENGWLNSSNAGGPIGIWAWDAKDIIIQYCESHHNKTNNKKDGGGFDLDGGCVNCIMQYNYSHDNHGAGYGIYQFNGAREFKNNIVRYNISENDGLVGNYGGINFWATNSNGGIQNTKVYNNTIYVSSQTTGAAITDFVAGTSYIYNSEIYNNIFVTAQNKKVVNLPKISGGWTFKGNCYWTYDNQIEIKWESKTFTSLDTWRNASGQEMHNGDSVGLEIDPQLNTPGQGGTIGDSDQLAELTAYKLKPTSPLINAGLNLNILFGIDVGEHDYYGVTIPQFGNYEIGAHESDQMTGIKEKCGYIPVDCQLFQNYPNPFNMNTVISFELPTDIRNWMAIYNGLGQEIVMLDDSYRQAGRHKIEWNGEDCFGSAVASGVYYCKMQTGNKSTAIKLIVTK